jgi:Fic family protein
MMLSYDLAKHPGLWRPGYVAVRNDTSGEIVYEGPESDMVPDLMRELIESLNAPSHLPVLVRAALAHLNLVMIHPFSDGNGRMARVLQSLVLAREGILEPEFCSIEEYLGRNTIDYYNVLAQVGQGKWHPKNSVKPWLRFCLTAHYRQAETLLRRTREMEQVWNEVERIVTRERLPERVALALFDAAYGWRVRSATYRSAAEVSEQVGGRDLKSLADRGLLIPAGEKRGRYYTGSTDILDIRKLILREKLVPDPFTLDQPSLPGLGAS